MISAHADPESAHLHAVPLSRRDVDRLVEAAGVLVGRDVGAANAQPDVEYFQQRLESSRSLLAALHEYQWRLRARDQG